MRDERASRFCDVLLVHWPALWSFTEIAGVEPTNIRAERALRFAVLLRLRSGGTAAPAQTTATGSSNGCSDPARPAASKAASLHHYLLDTITAALHSQPAPSLTDAPPRP